VKLTSEIQCIFFSLGLSVSKGIFFFFLFNWSIWEGGGLTVHSLSSIRGCVSVLIFPVGIKVV
jgi:hypothetical protein